MNKKEDRFDKLIKLGCHRCSDESIEIEVVDKKDHALEDNVYKVIVLTCNNEDGDKILEIGLRDSMQFHRTFAEALNILIDEDNKRLDFILAGDGR